MAAASTLDITIVGAGLGGLAASIACAIAGHRVSLLEAAHELAEIGAGVQLTPNASYLLQQWGLSAAIDELGAEPTVLTVHRYTGQILAEERDFAQSIRRKYQAPFLDMHRADLQRLLHRRARDLGVSVRLGARVSRVDSSRERPTIVLESGETMSADLVVGADGLWSKCRESMLGTSDKPLPTGDLAYRIVLELDQIQDPELRALVANPEVHFWIGPHAHAVAYSLKGGTMFNIVLLCLDDLPSDVSRSSGSVEEMKRLFADWDPILTRFLGHVDKVDKWKLMHRAALDTWTNDRKNFVLIGDSCHPMLPYLAQGANSSLEDGAVLGRLLSYVSSSDQLPWAIKLYETLRKDRSEGIVRETFLQRDAFHLPDGPEQQERDAVFAARREKLSNEPFPSRWTCPVVQPWLYGYDSIAVADEAVRKNPPTKSFTIARVTAGSDSMTSQEKDGESEPSDLGVKHQSESGCFPPSLSKFMRWLRSRL